MAHELIMPEGKIPTNLHLKAEVEAVHITSDLFNIAERIREIDPALFIVQLREDDKFAWSIMEQCPDGVARLVFRANELDGRVLEKLRRIMSVDLHRRLELLDREREKLEADQYEKDAEELYEQLGGPMWVELERTGFIQRPVSYRPMNRAARRAGRRMTRS